MNKILVTGGHGFLGSAVVRELTARGYRNVHAPGSVELNLLDAAAVMGDFMVEEYDTVVHCAAKVGGIKDNVDYPADFVTENLRMGLNILQASARFKVQTLCIIGTSCSYPANAQCPISEESLFHGPPARETAPYGIPKSTLFVAASAFKQQYDLRSLLLVPTNLYGPGDRSTHVIPDIIRKFKSTPDDGVVKIWGSGRATRDFLYVDDCAAGIVQALQGPPQPVVPINLATGVETPIYEVADRIRRICGSHAKIEYENGAPEGQIRRVLSAERADKWFGWRATTTLEDGLRKTIEAYK